MPTLTALLFGFVFVPLLAWSQSQSDPPHVVQFKQAVVSVVPKDLIGNLRISYDFATSSVLIKTGPVVGNRIVEPWGFYQIKFESGISQVLQPSLRASRGKDPKGNYVKPSMRLDSWVLPTEGVSDQRLGQLVRSMLRADPFVNQVLAYAKNGGPIQLSEPQLNALMSSQTEQPGLISHYLAHVAKAKKDPALKPFVGALILPTGVGKTIVAFKAIEIIEKIMQSPKETASVVFMVQNAQILDDIWTKLRKRMPNNQIARLYGSSAGTEITYQTRLVLATRSTGVKRASEIFMKLKQRDPTVPMITFFDEAHHTGKSGGEWTTIKSVWKNFAVSTDVLIDLTATPWHEDKPDLVADFRGRVGTAFMDLQDRQLFMRGQDVQRIARLQVLRAMSEGWLSPLTGVRFITESEAPAGYPKSKLKPIDLFDQERRENVLAFAKDELSKMSEVDVVVDGTSDKNREDQSDLAINLKSGHVAKAILRLREIHLPLLEMIKQDILDQFLFDENNKVAEYDRGAVYVPTIVHAIAFETILNQLFKSSGAQVEFRSIHSGQPLQVRQQNIDWMNETEADGPQYKHKFLIAVQILDEGVDIPALNRIILAKPIYEVKKLLQIVGRGTRVATGKTGTRITDYIGGLMELFKQAPAEFLQFPRPANSKNQEVQASIEAQKKQEVVGVLLNGQPMTTKQIEVWTIDSPLEAQQALGLESPASEPAVVVEAMKQQLTSDEPIQSVEVVTGKIETSDSKKLNRPQVEVAADLMRKHVERLSKQQFSATDNDLRRIREKTLVLLYSDMDQDVLPAPKLSEMYANPSLSIQTFPDKRSISDADVEFEARALAYILKALVNPLNQVEIARSLNAGSNANETFMEFFGWVAQVFPLHPELPVDIFHPQLQKSIDFERYQKWVEGFQSFDKAFNISIRDQLFETQLFGSRVYHGNRRGVSAEAAHLLTFGFEQPRLIDVLHTAVGIANQFDLVSKDQKHQKVRDHMYSEFVKIGPLARRYVDLFMRAEIFPNNRLDYFGNPLTQGRPVDIYESWAASKRYSEYPNHSATSFGSFNRYLQLHLKLTPSDSNAELRVAPRDRQFHMLEIYIAHLIFEFANVSLTTHKRIELPSLTGWEPPRELFNFQGMDTLPGKWGEIATVLGALNNRNRLAILSLVGVMEEAVQSYLTTSDIQSGSPKIRMEILKTSDLLGSDSEGNRWKYKYSHVIVAHAHEALDDPAVVQILKPDLSDRIVRMLLKQRLKWKAPFVKVKAGLDPAKQMIGQMKDSTLKTLLGPVSAPAGVQLNWGSGSLASTLRRMEDHWTESKIVGQTKKTILPLHLFAEVGPRWINALTLLFASDKEVLSLPNAGRKALNVVKEVKLELIRLLGPIETQLLEQILLQSNGQFYLEQTLLKQLLATDADGSPCEQILTGNSSSVETEDE